MGVIVEMIKIGGRESCQNLCIKSYMESDAADCRNYVMKVLELVLESLLRSQVDINNM